MEKILIIGAGDYGRFINAGLQAEFETRMIDGLDFDPAQIPEKYVYVATPHFTHFDITTSLLQAGKDVLCEKPLALSLEKVKKVYSLADKNGRYLGMGLLLQNHPFYIYLKELQDNLGPIKSMKVVNNATESRIETDWYWNQEKSGGWFIVSEIHWYHLFAWLTEADEAVVVEARESKKDGRTTYTESSVQTDMGQSLTVEHRLDSKDEEISCTVTIEFEGLTATIEGWIPNDINMTDRHFMPDTSIAGSKKDDVYHNLILQNVINMQEGRKYDTRAVVLAHDIAFKAQLKADSIN